MVVLLIVAICVSVIVKIALTDSLPTLRIPVSSRTGGNANVVMGNPYSSKSVEEYASITLYLVSIAWRDAIHTSQEVVMTL